MKPRWKRAQTQALILSLAFGIAALLVVYAMMLSRSFTQCVADKQDDNSTQQQKERSAYFKAEIVVFCSGVFLNRDSGAVQAVTAVVVAIFTVVLARTTRKQVSVADRQAEIADRQLRMLEVLERPFIFPIINMDFTSYVQNLVGIPNEGWPDQPFHFPQPGVAFRVHNYGKSPAIITAVFVTTEVRVEAPIRHVTIPGIRLPEEIVVAPGTRTDDLAAENFFRKLFYMTREELNLILKGKLYIWVLGQVGYIDIFGTQWVYHFCWKYTFSGQRFSPWPLDANYTEKRRRPENNS